MSSQSHAVVEPSPVLDAPRSIANHLTQRIGSHRYKMWFGATTMTVDGCAVEIAADSPFVAHWIESHFADVLRDAARATLGDESTVSVSVARRAAHSPARGPRAGGTAPIAVGSVLYEREEPFPFAADKQAAGKHPAKSRDKGTAGRRAMRGNLRRLEDFVVGPSNQLAYSAARALAEDGEASVISPLFIHGECGVGKTHLLQGVCRHAASMHGAANVRYVTGEQFTNEFIASVRNQSIDAFRDRIRKLDLLAIDDVQFLSNKSRTQSEFLHTLDAIGHLGARIVLTSNEHPRQITRFSPSLVSRLLAGMVVQVDTPDRETRLKLVRHIAASRNLLLLDAAAELIASRCVGSVRELEGAITKLAAMKNLSGPRRSGDSGEVGLLLVEQLFSDQAWQPAAPVRIASILDTVCSRLGVSRGDLTSTGRHRRVVLARALVAYLGREMTTMSFPEIAQAMGRAHHSTIHTAANRLTKQLAANERVTLSSRESVLLRDLVDQVRHAIKRN